MTGDQYTPKQAPSSVTIQCCCLMDELGDGKRFETQILGYWADSVSDILTVRSGKYQFGRVDEHVESFEVVIHLRQNRKQWSRRKRTKSKHLLRVIELKSCDQLYLHILCTSITRPHSLRHATANSRLVGDSHSHPKEFVPLANLSDANFIHPAFYT